MIKRLEAKVSGNVINVMYRDYVQRNARALSLTGWVRNEKDASVSVVAEGEEENLEKLEKILHTCPLHTRTRCKVESVESIYKEPVGEFKTFEIDYANSWI